MATGITSTGITSTGITSMEPREVVFMRRATRTEPLSQWLWGLLLL